MTLVEFHNLLKSTGITTVRYLFNTQQQPPYIQWGEDSEADSVWTDNRMKGQVVQGTVDLFTRTYDAVRDFNIVNTTLKNSGISFRFNSRQYESDEKIMHFEWVWELWLD